MNAPVNQHTYSSQKKFRRWAASWCIVLTLFSPAALIGVTTAITIGVTAARPAHAQLSVVADVEAVLEWILNLIKNGLISAGKVAIKNYIRSFLEKLAYDSAVWIASGGEGQAPLVFTKDVGTYISEAGDAAIGEFLNTIAQENGLVEFDLCELPTPEASLSFQLQLGTAVAPTPSGPGSARCTLSDIQKSLAESGATLQQQAAAFIADPNAFVNFTTSLQPGGNYASSLDVASNIAIESEATAEATAELKRLKSDFDDKAAKVSGYIQTPSSLVKNQLEESLNQATGGELTQVNDVIADAAGVFLDTLSAKLMDRVSSGLLSFFTDADISESLSGGSSTSGRSAGVSGAREKYANFVTPSFNTSGTIDILNYFANCPEEGADVINCVVDEKMRRAIADGVSVQELADNYVGRDSPFAFDANGANITDPSQGISLRNIKILKQYSVVPVGWQLAAEYNRDFDATSLTLQSVIDQFDDCGTDAATYSPYCGLVDPQWTLKAPDVFCKAEGFGQTIASDTFVDLDGNAYTPEKQLVSRLSSCLDPQSCLSEDDNGACTAYGYCTTQKPIYRFEGDSCPSYEASCEIFTDTHDDQVAYLKNTLNYNDCSSETVGCQWYSSLYNEYAAAFQSADQTHIYPTCTNAGGCSCSVDSDENGTVSDDETCTISNGSFSCLTTVGANCTQVPVENFEASIAFDNDVQTCTDEDAGCSEFVQIAGGNNLLVNSSFEEFDDFHDASDQAALDSLVDAIDPEAFAGAVGAYDDTFGFFGENGNGAAESAGAPCSAATDSTHPCYGWELLDGAVARAVFTAAEGVVAIQLNNDAGGTVSSSVDTGYPLANRTFVLSLNYLNPDINDCSGEVWIRPDDGSTSPEAETVTYNSSSDAISFSDFTSNILTFGSSVTTSSIRVGITVPPTCDLVLDAIQLEENTEATSYAAYGARPLNLNINKTEQCSADDIGCALYTPQTGESTIDIPGQITNPASEACGNGSDFSLASCSQCTVQFVGCDAYIEEPTPYNAPVHDITGFDGFDTDAFDSANAGLAAAVASRTGYYCDGTTTSCSPDRAERDCGAAVQCLPSISIVPTTGESCSAQDVGCEEYVNLDTQAQGGEGLEYYTYIKQCVKPTEAQQRDGELDIYYTYEGSDITGLQLRTWELKKSNIDNGPCTNVDYYGSTAETPEANCIDTVDTQHACVAEDVGVNPDCTEYFDSNGGVFYRLKSATITVTDECIGLRNSLDSRVYYSAPSESMTCSAAANQCREYRGSEGGSAQFIISETFDSTVWSGGESSSTAVSAGGGQSMAIGDGTATGATEATVSVANQVTDDQSTVVSFWAKVKDAGSNSIKPFFKTSAGTEDTFVGTPFTFTSITSGSMDSATSTFLSFWDESDFTDITQGANSGFIISNTTNYVNFPGPGDNINPATAQPLLVGSNSGGWHGLDAPRTITLQTDAGSITFTLPQSDIVAQGNVLFYVDVDGNTYWADADHNGDNGDFLTHDQAMRSANLAYGATPAPTPVYTYYYFGANGATTDAAAAGVQLSTEWQRYTMGPFIFPNGVAGDEAFGFAFSGADGQIAYIDTVDLQRNASYYLIHNSASLCPGYEGCEEYRDDRGATEYIKSFTKICEEEAVGCEAVFDTHNSTSPFYQSFNSANEFDEDDEFVPVDNPTAYVVTEEALCTSDVVGCSLFGKPDLDAADVVQSFESVYLIDDPDTYGTALCQQQQLHCSEYSDSSGAPVYFKDPGDKTCSYDSGSGMWKKADGSECPVQNENASPSQPKGPICDGGLRDGQLCSRDSDCPDTDGVAIHRCVSNQDEYSGWTGLCSDSFSGCTLYMDPNTDSLIRNGNFESDTTFDTDINLVTPADQFDNWVRASTPTVDSYANAIAASNSCNTYGRIQGTAFDGEYSAQVVAGAASNAFCALETEESVPVNTNNYYTLSGHVSLTNASARFAIGLLYFDANGDPIDVNGSDPDNEADSEIFAFVAYEGADRSSETFETNKWYRFQGTIGPNLQRTFPEGTYYVKVFIESGDNTAGVYFDDISFALNEEYTYVNTTVDGSGLSDATSCSTVDIAGGCVAFRDVTNDNVPYLSSIEEEQRVDPNFTPTSDCEFDSALPDQSCDSRPNTTDTNVVIKVRNDRECAEWLACSSARVFYDDAGNAVNTTCFDVGTCVHRNEDTGVCTEWKQSVAADDLDTESDESVNSGPGDTAELNAIQQASGYADVGAIWQGICEAGFCSLGTKGAQCSTNADCTAITYGSYPVDWMPQRGMGGAASIEDIVPDGTFEDVTCIGDAGESTYDGLFAAAMQGNLQRARNTEIQCTLDKHCRTNDTEQEVKEILDGNGSIANIATIDYSEGWCANVKVNVAKADALAWNDWLATSDATMSIIDYDATRTYTTTIDSDTPVGASPGALSLDLNNVLYVQPFNGAEAGTQVTLDSNALTEGQEYVLSFDAQYIGAPTANDSIKIGLAYGNISADLFTPTQQQLDAVAAAGVDVQDFGDDNTVPAIANNETLQDFDFNLGDNPANNLYDPGRFALAEGDAVEATNYEFHTALDYYNYVGDTYEGSDSGSTAFQFTTQYKRYVLGPLTIQEFDPNTTVQLFILQSEGSTNLPFVIDNISLKPAIEVNKEGNVSSSTSTALISRECRGYPEQNSVQCDYTRQNGAIYSGWKGYCLAHDEYDTSKCVAWWPVDVLAGEPDSSSRPKIRYTEKYPAYHCLVAKGNEQLGACKSGGQLCASDDDCAGSDICLAGDDSDPYSTNDGLSNIVSTNNYIYTHEIDDFLIDTVGQDGEDDDANQDYARFEKIEPNNIEKSIHISEIDRIRFEQGHAYIAGGEPEGPMEVGGNSFDTANKIEVDEGADGYDLADIIGDRVDEDDADVDNGFYNDTGDPLDYALNRGIRCNGSDCTAENVAGAIDGDGEMWVYYVKAVTVGWAEGDETPPQASTHYKNDNEPLSPFEEQSSLFDENSSIWGCHGQIGAGTGPLDDLNKIDCDGDGNVNDGNGDSAEFPSYWDSEETIGSSIFCITGDGADQRCGANIILWGMQLDGGYIKNFYYGVWNGMADYDYNGVNDIYWALYLKEPCLLAVEAANEDAEAIPWQTRIHQDARYTVQDIGYSHSMTDGTREYNSLFATIGGDGAHNPAEIDGIEQEFTDDSLLDFTEVATDNLPYVYATQSKGSALPYACIGTCTNAVCQDDYGEGEEEAAVYPSSCIAGWIGVPGLCQDTDGNIAFNSSTEAQFCEVDDDCANIDAAYTCKKDLQLDNQGTGSGYTNYTQQLNAAAAVAWSRYRLLFADIGGTLWYAQQDGSYSKRGAPYLTTTDTADIDNVLTSAFDTNFNTMPECSDGTRDADEYCGIRPNTENITLNNNESGDITLENGSSVSLLFDSGADADQQPVQNIYIAWEGHDDSVDMTQENKSIDIWQAAPIAGHNYTHVYTCDPTGDYWDGDQQMCVYHLKVQIADNWGFCSGDINTTTVRNNCTSYDSYAGTIYINP